MKEFTLKKDHCKQQAEELKPLLKEHMHDSMLYKIHDIPNDIPSETSSEVTLNSDTDFDIGEF